MATPIPAELQERLKSFADYYNLPEGEIQWRADRDGFPVEAEGLNRAARSARIQMLDNRRIDNEVFNLWWIKPIAPPTPALSPLTK